MSYAVNGGSLMLLLDSDLTLSVFRVDLAFYIIVTSTSVIW